VKAVSGKPREDTSVGAEGILVDPVDSRSIRITYADTVDNEDVSLTVTRNGAFYEIDIVRRHWSPEVEIAHDRVIVLTFDRDIPVDNVHAEVRNNGDTGDHTDD
jgi:hypothetical protein